MAAHTSHEYPAARRAPIDSALSSATPHIARADESRNGTCVCAISAAVCRSLSLSRRSRHRRGLDACVFFADEPREVAATLRFTDDAFLVLRGFLVDDAGGAKPRVLAGECAAGVGIGRVGCVDARGGHREVSPRAPSTGAGADASAASCATRTRLAVRRARPPAALVAGTLSLTARAHAAATW